MTVTLSTRRVWPIDSNRKWFRSQKWRRTTQTSGDGRQNWGFAARVETAKTWQDTEDYMRTKCIVKIFFVVFLSLLNSQLSSLIDLKK